MATKIQVRRDTSANWTSINPTLFEGEIGFETNTGKLKVGRSNISWNNLPYAVDTAYTFSNYEGNFYQASNSLDTIPRYITIGSRLVTNGLHPFGLFVANKNFTVNNITMVSHTTTGTADVGGTSVRRMGLYTYNNTTNAYTLVARTANDPTLWSAAATVYTRALNTTGGYPSSYNLTAGTSYAIGVIAYNTGGTFNQPQIAGGGTNGNAGTTGLVPFMSAVVTGQTDLSVSGTATVSSQSIMYARLT